MPDDNAKPAHATRVIDFQTEPSRYRHWKLAVDGDIATLTLDVDENGGLFDGYQLKLNSYDLGVDIELSDALRRIRFEHPEVRALLLRSGKERVFCAGANIRMLAAATHAHKVNFCKFTNETRNAIEDMSAHSGIPSVCILNGTAAGGGYELALAADRIVLVDDGSSTVSLPEVALLAVLPGTGGLTRVTDKRKVRRDLADVFCSIEEGIKGKRAVEWRLVDELAPQSRLATRALEVARDLAAKARRPAQGPGITLEPLVRKIDKDTIDYGFVSVVVDRAQRTATITVSGPPREHPASVSDLIKAGSSFWPLQFARELDDAILHLRANEPEIGTVVFKSAGSSDLVLAYDDFLERHKEHWLANEIRQLWKGVLKRIDVTSRSLAAFIEPGSCFSGMLAEIVFACDRSYMLSGQFEGDNRPPATIALSAANFGPYPMCNGITRLQSRFLAEPEAEARLRANLGAKLDAAHALAAGLVTYAPDDIDWPDEVRVFLEERASFSPDALTGMEANLRFAGPETMESKIFARLTAWQNWIFQRPNAIGENGALRRYGSGQKPAFDLRRV
jgi:benzoyl-CoA-dihydrodiol lyase